MSSIRCFGALVLSLLLVAMGPQGVSGVDDNSQRWLRGSGTDLQLILTGEVFGLDGLPAAGFQLTGEAESTGRSRPLECKIEGNRFEASIPVNRWQPHAVWLRAASDDGRLAYKKFSQYELRQAAIDGIKLTLESPSRHVVVKVLDAGKPVEDAKVKAELGFGIQLRAQTDEQGIARFDLLPRQELASLMAWSDDHRVGGFGFDRSPPRDESANEHVVELSACRDQRIRFLDETGKPVPGVNFRLQIATPTPDFNFIGTNEHSPMTSDAAGEAVFHWFPDWNESYCYAELGSEAWVLDGEPQDIDHVKVQKLKRSKPRQKVGGHVTAPDTFPGGFYVQIYSFQGEQEQRSDVLATFTNPDGTFEFDVLPDATYAAWILDTRWVSDVTGVTPYQTKPQKITSPEIKVAKGQEVRVEVTSGANNKPVRDLTVAFHRRFDFAYTQEGRTQTGVTGPQWWAATDNSGQAVTRAFPGKMDVSVYTPRWRTEKSVKVVAGEPTTIQLHREIDETRKIKGLLILEDGVATKLDGATVKLGSLDENYRDQQSTTCAANGTFSFETLAANVGLFAVTADGAAAGSMILGPTNSPIELRLRPTFSYAGQLLTEGDQPAGGYRILALVRVGNRGTGNAEPFQPMSAKAATDDDGNFQLENLPLGAIVTIFAYAPDHSEDSSYVDRITADSTEQRPRAVHRMQKTIRDASPQPLAERYRSALRDAAISGYRVLLIVAPNDPNIASFVDRTYLDHNANPDAYPFMQVKATDGVAPLDSAGVAFLKEHQWSEPVENQVAAYVIDGDGRELGRQQIDLANSTADGQVADFLRQYTPPRHDAVESWSAAFAEAKRTNRRVWVRVSERYCGPCLLLSRWLDEHRDTLGKDYVLLKIDDFHDTNGATVAERVTAGKIHGIPFHAIFDADEKMLIDSTGPLGNIGSAGGEEGKRHLRKMLLQTRQDISDAEIDALIESVDK